MTKKISIILLCLLVMTFVLQVQARGRDAVLVMYGDSFIGGKGIPREYNFTQRVQKMYKNQGFNIKTVNSGVDGLTASQALELLDEKVFLHSPDVVFLQLGRVDAINSEPINQLQHNLEKVVWRILKSNSKIKIILIGNYFGGTLAEKDYRISLNNMYVNVAAKYQIVLYPDYTYAIGRPGSFFQIDGVHPNGYGTERIVEAMAPYMNEYVKDASSAALFE